MASSGIRVEPFFLESPRGPLFCLYTAPADAPPTGSVLYLHPFAEEMHKSRRMAALQVRHLASAGLAVLQPDLSGCGDSAGDFADASLSGWRDDASRALDWLRGRVPGPPVLWGLRLGASLAAELASRAEAARLVLWQPVVAGELFLNQFLRIRLAAEMLADGKAQADTRALREALAGGATLEVGGYGLGPDMARELAELKLAAARPGCAVTWLEVGAVAGSDIAPAGRRVVEAWRADQVAVETATVAGDPFWATQEICECPALLAPTLAAVEASP